MSRSQLWPCTFCGRYLKADEGCWTEQYQHPHIVSVWCCIPCYEKRSS